MSVNKFKIQIHYYNSLVLVPRVNQQPKYGAISLPLSACKLQIMCQAKNILTDRQTTDRRNQSLSHSPRLCFWLLNSKAETLNHFYQIPVFKHIQQMAPVLPYQLLLSDSVHYNSSQACDIVRQKLVHKLNILSREYLTFVFRKQEISRQVFVTSSLIVLPLFYIRPAQ